VKRAIRWVTIYGNYALVTVFAAFPSGLDSDLRLRSLLWSGSSR